MYNYILMIILYLLLCIINLFKFILNFNYFIYIYSIILKLRFTGLDYNQGQDTIDD